MKFSSEQIERELRGYYRTGCFHIYLNTCYYKKLEDMNSKDLGTFIHEYVHYIQNLSTPYGIFETETHYKTVIETFKEIDSKDNITIPYKSTFSDEIKNRLDRIKAMNGDILLEENCQDTIDENFKMLLSFDDYEDNYGKGRKVCVRYKTIEGLEKKRYIGALDIKEGMAVAYQSLFDDKAAHPDIPYNILSILCKQHFPSIYRDVKKFICICYTSLFSLSPADLFIFLCEEENSCNTKSGFQIFDSFISKIQTTNDKRNESVYGCFNKHLEKFKNSIKEFIKIDTLYIDIVLDAMKLENGNVPILNIINTESPITVKNIRALINVVGVPFIHFKNGECLFPSLDENATPDVVHIVSLTWIYEFLVQENQSKIGICPFVKICEIGKYCYDKPWLEKKDDCPFRLIATNLNLINKIS